MNRLSPEPEPRCRPRSTTHAKWPVPILALLVAAGCGGDDKSAGGSGGSANPGGAGSGGVTSSGGGWASGGTETGGAAGGSAAAAGAGASAGSSGAAGGGAGSAGAGSGGASGSQTLNYSADNTTELLNPERGWMLRGDESVFAKARGGDSDHPQGYSVVWSDMGSSPWNGSTGTPFRLDNYKTQNLPATLLQKLEAVFAAARTSGVKLKLRFAYNYSGSGDDTTKSWMITHIGQLGPVLTANADVIASMDMGFVGRWGELNGSTKLVSSTQPWWQEPWISARNEVLNALLAGTPKWLSIGNRYPLFVRQRFGESSYAMNLSAKFSGTDQSRVGWYNDCIWTDKTNTGTYSFDVSEARGNLDRDTFEKIGRYAATSGETCSSAGLSAYNTCSAVLADMALINGPDTLFRKYWVDIYNRWITDGCYSEISRRLGYRLQLVSATLPTHVEAGSSASATLVIRNSGFGKVYNPRPIDLVFVGAAGSFTARLSADARKELPLAGDTSTHTWSFTVPAGLQSGKSYALHLRLPDPSGKLEKDNRYAIRLANGGGIWDGSTGRHDLGASVTAP